MHSTFSTAPIVGAAVISCSWKMVYTADAQRTAHHPLTAVGGEDDEKKAINVFAEYACHYYCYKYRM